MNKNDNLSKSPKISIVRRVYIPKEEVKNFDEVMREVETDITLEQLYEKFKVLVKRVTVLSLLLGDLQLIDWLQDWESFQFDNMTEDEIKASKIAIQTWVAGLLLQTDATTGSYHSIYFNWVKHDPITYTVQAYLNPPAVLGIIPGYGTGIVSPTPPRQPPPPSL